MNARILREPLLHFLLLGAALFAISALRDGGPAAGSSRITVTPQRVAQLAALFERTWQRPPSEAELDGLIEEFVKDEIYYREARALGLDQDDTIIRRRLRQKLEFLSDEAGSAPPTDQELQAFLEERMVDYRIPPRVALRQIYFSVDRRGERAETDARALLAQLPTGRWPDSGTQLGDPLLLTTPAGLLPTFEVARLYGTAFAKAVAELPVGVWSGPVVSGFGVHLVLILERQAGRPAALDEVRQQVTSDWHAARRDRAASDYYQELRRRYQVEVAMPTGWKSPPAAEDRK
jgi:hypothetical protein